jgi:hypothetical protein
MSSRPSQWRASSRLWLETSSVAPRSAGAREQAPQLDAEQRVKPDGRLVEDQQLGLAEEHRRERDPRALAAGEVPDELAGAGGDRNGLEDLVDAGAGDPEDAGEEAEVLAHGEIAVHRRRLGHVADARPQRGAACRAAEHIDASAGGALHADDRAHQRGLAAAARAHQPGDRARGHLELRDPDDLVAAAADDEVPDGDGGLRHEVIM